MQIIARVTQGDLNEMGITINELREVLIKGIDDAREYPPFDVTVEFIAED